jgi:hypothetical protein
MRKDDRVPEFSRIEVMALPVKATVLSVEQAAAGEDRLVCRTRPTGGCVSLNGRRTSNSFANGKSAAETLIGLNAVYGDKALLKSAVWVFFFCMGYAVT